MKNRLRPLMLIALMLALSLPAIAEETELADAISEYLEFEDYGGGNILPQQIPRDEWQNLYIVDTRRAEDFAQGHIPDAVNIEWRELVVRRAELPRDRTVIVYCNTGSLSAQAAFALKLLGYDNVKILTGGYNQFKALGNLGASDDQQTGAKP